MLVFLSILIAVYGQYTCSTAKNFNLPQFHSSVTFGSSTPKSKVAFEAGSLKEVQGKYFVTTVPEDLEDFIMNINTCSATTNLATEIYVFTACSEDGIAQTLAASSGVDNNCEAGSDFPVINANVKTGTTYYILVKLIEENAEGTVNLAIDQSYADNSHIECNVAREVKSLPYTDQAQLVLSKTPAIKVDCITTAASSLWYKFKGDGKYLVVNTCNYYTNFDTRIAVVKDLVNGRCNGGKCVKFADDGCGRTSTSSILVIKTEVDQYYYIGVSGAVGQEGQFQISMDHLADAIPATCVRALPIQELPFSRSIDIPDVWPTVKPTCIPYHNDVRAVYMTLVGTGKPVVISTCKSVDSNLKPIGVAVEMVNNCEEEKCAVNITNSKEFGECGENNYVVKTLEKDKTYYIKAYCPNGPCEITLNIYEKTASHDTCDTALELNDPGVFSEVAVVENLQSSIHGCDSHALTDHGLWYKLMHTKSIENEQYSIIAMNAQRSKVGHIEFSYGCMIIECEALQQGEAKLSFEPNQEYQYVFVYPDAATGQKALIVQFIKQESTLFHRCEDALPVTLPYTALHTFSNTKTRQICTGETAAANYYRFRVPRDIEVDVSTCFPKTLVDTGVEITQGCFSDSNHQCMGYNTEGKGCANGAAKVSVDLKGNTDYTLSVFSQATAALNVKQYRVVLFSLEIPKNSACNAPIIISPEDNYAEFLVLNRLSYKTDFGDHGITRGNYFKVASPDTVYTVTVRTCSIRTTMNSFILAHSECVVKGTAEQPISNPTESVGIASSSVTNCDIHGTYLSFDTVPNKDFFVFVGPENFAEEGFIDVQFYMDVKEGPVDPSEEPESSDDPNNNKDDDDKNSTPTGWIVFGVLVYILFAAVLAGCVVAIVLKRRGSGYATLA